MTAALLSATWEKQKKGGSETLEELLASEGDNGREELMHKLLYASYLTAGPKVSTANRKAVTALSGEDAAAFRAELLKCLLDETAEVPRAAQKLVGDLEGTDRQAALMQTRSIFVYTHDSIGVGEDGPTHQPVEHVASLRLIPGRAVWSFQDKLTHAFSSSFG